jgi:hypothetical protein
MRRAPGCHGAHRHNDSVPLAVIMSTSWSGSCSREQLPSGLRARTARAVTVAVKLPVVLLNCLVPPAISPVWRIVIAAPQQRCHHLLSLRRPVHHPLRHFQFRRNQHLGPLEYQRPHPRGCGHRSRRQA